MTADQWPRLGPRAQQAIQRQQGYHETRIGRAATVLDKLRAACMWLVAESKRGGPDALGEDLETVLELVERRRQANLPTTKEEAA